MEVITAYDAEQLLKNYARVSTSLLTHNVDQALKFAAYPAALKIVSKKALHKTEIKGVRIVHNKQDLMQQYGDLLKNALHRHIHIEGILVQDFEEGSEVFIGIKKDDVFGHVIGLGVGGILVEELKDVQWRRCPITSKDAESMLDNLKYKNIIIGARGNHNNVNGLKKTLIRLSNFPRKHPKLKEMDINPLILNHRYATIVDARMVFE